MAESKVIYRDFCEKDICDVANLLASIWYPELSGEAALCAGKMDLAHFAANTSHMRVAALDGSVVGIAAVRVKSPNKETVLKWKKFYSDVALRLQSLEPRVAQEILDYCSFEKKAQAKMLSECSDCLDYELTLFAVSSKARGHGVGSTLLKQAVQYLKEAGAKSYFLFTDTSCTWQYYENRGMKRISSYHLTDEEVDKFQLQELYVYSTEI